MVTQESVLFNDSVYNNIWMGKTEASEEEVIHAAKIANAHQFIENLPEKYQTNIGIFPESFQNIFLISKLLLFTTSKKASQNMAP